MTDIRAEVRLPTNELRDDIPFFTNVLKMRMDTIYPADDPTVAVFSGHGLRVRVDANASEPAGTLRILTDDPDGFAGAFGSVELTGRRCPDLGRQVLYTRDDLFL